MSTRPDPNKKQPQKSPIPADENAPSDNPEGDDRIRVNGYQQVLEMLKIADPEFRESLLRRLAMRDPRLAKTLRSEI